jgi:osmotically-inducible protein OsmY
MAPTLRLFPAAFCAAALLCVLALTGCRRSDDEIASDARTQLAADSSLHDASISIIVKKGVVLLRGRTAAADQRREAAARISKVAGVHTVINQLTLSDQGIRTGVEHAFAEDSLLGGVPIVVTVTDGVVHLSSSATSADQRARAVALARAVEGVRGVEDDMR